METRPYAGQIVSLVKAAATLGPGWALTRSQLALTKRLGLLSRRTPLGNWSEIGLEKVLKPGVPAKPYEYGIWRSRFSPAFLFKGFAPDFARAFIGLGAVQLADQVLHGDFPFFGYVRPVGFPPAWRSDSRGHTTTPAGHWSTIDEFGSGDIKLTWEPSRFTWVYALARAYTRSYHEPYADAFWTLFESWLDSNPPNAGANWKCGQEASFRAMALCFALYAFAQSPASTSQRIARFVAAIAIHARRINAYIAYALSQKNNHGISEGVGLWTIGLLFPELKDSEEWKARGREVIEKEVRRQIYADGSYVQHSMNYHRVMLHDVAWALRLGEVQEEKFPDDIYDLFRRSVYFLHALTDPLSGYAPNYGANDGALVLPLSDCSYPDMRPVLQACYFLIEQRRLYAPGPWDEEMVWLNGQASGLCEEGAKPVSEKDLCAEVGGYYTLRSPNSWLMVRGAKYQDRPSHADQLAVDMWWCGENILCDPGTYSYNSPPPFDHGFASTRYHNCVTVDNADQMTKLSRFLWVDWATAHIQRDGDSASGCKILEGEQDGYKKKRVKQRRAIAQIDASTWMVVDDLTGCGEHNFRLHWLTQDVPFTVISPGALECDFKHEKMRMHLRASRSAQFDIVRSGNRVFGERVDPPDPARGWQSRYYARKEPALSIVLEGRSTLPVRFITVVALGIESNVELPSLLKDIAIGDRRITLSDIGSSPIFIQII
jgi:hypothetical protein